ncbi:U-box domain-containing protein 3-like [Cucurbita moschata]|uniref:RING-type E3 ubiquitin transferase n=1 Tax=Cucurbita moschata TaxID=3662 RepID=A0A6J1GQL0_CUCMO|nr:U-box domain-containing protein 3-like [Cucurbita moschata]XP_022953755.1 U-box domain-containing protein 3-like [Cucurbita moschata]XP_022953756.1 U-box domain-containing protein 3-like [Cucurbita moschata]XP_022953757.1 U-box domain-containing protein 3-like [Cucurbita moschata]
MGTASVQCLTNSISRFIHLVSCHTTKPLPLPKSCKDLVVVLKLLKLVLDDVISLKLSSNELHHRECELLDTAVNEAREFLENWCPKTSKICRALKCDPLLIKIQDASQAICENVWKSSESVSCSSSLSAVQKCLEGLQSLKQERISESIEEALISQRSGIGPNSEQLLKIIEALHLLSNQELLKETIAIEKERIDAECNDAKEELHRINQIMDLIIRMRDWMVRKDYFHGINGVSVPSYFRCPLSLELMLDPVIVASGQTYDRSSIQKWIDSGLNICPNTHQMLTHTNLTPNYTVKAMISNWCDENKLNISNLSSLVLNRSDSFRYSLHGSNSTARSSSEVEKGSDKQNGDVFAHLIGENSNESQGNEAEKFDPPSPQQSYIYSRSVSTSSAFSSIDYIPSAFNESLKTSNKRVHTKELSGEITSERPAASLSEASGITSSLGGGQLQACKTGTGIVENGNCNGGMDNLSGDLHIKKLIADLKSQRDEVQMKGAEELRLLAKDNVENRVIIGRYGAIGPLLSLLYSERKLIQEHAVTALLNLSINENNKAMIAEAGAIEPLIHVLKTGSSAAKENSAATLFSLSVLEEYKAKIGRSGAVKALVDLLGVGTLRGKKDAATALFNLSIFHENKARIVQAGAVKYLVELLDTGEGMVDKAAALLANLSTISEGRLGIVREGGIPLLVEIVESGSMRGKENVASILLQLCLHSSKFCTLVLQEGAVPPLVALSQSGTPRAKEKAQQLLSHFRNQRDGSTGKGK